MKHLLTAALITAGTMATAQGGCMNREDMVQYLTNNLYQSAHWAAVSNFGEFTELWQHDSGDWTITIYNPTSDIMCAVSAGHSGAFSIPARGEKL